MQKSIHKTEIIPYSEYNLLTPREELYKLNTEEKNKSYF